jgi:hypothetical protein
MALKEDKQYYEYLYIGSLFQGGEPIFKLTEEELDLKGFDLEEIEDSIRSRERYDAYYWTRTRVAIARGQEGTPYGSEADISIEYAEQLEKVRNSKIKNSRKEEKIYEDRFLKELKAHTISYCEQNNLAIGVRTSKNGNICLYKNDKLLITFFFKKDDKGATKTLFGMYKDIEYYEKYRLWDIFCTFEEKRGTMSYDGRKIIYSSLDSNTLPFFKKSKVNDKKTKSSVRRRNNIERTR